MHKERAFIKRYSKGKRYLLVFVLISSLFYSLFVLINPLILQFTIDVILEGQAPKTSLGVNVLALFGGLEGLRKNTWLMGAGIAITAILSGLFLFVRNYAAGVYAESTIEALRKDLYDHIQKLPFSFHNNVRSGDLIQRASSDIDLINNFLSIQIRELLYSFMTTVLAFIVLFQLNVKLSFLSMLTFPLIFYYAFVFFKKMQAKFRESDEAEASLSAMFQESLDGVRVVKAFNNEQLTLEKFEEANKIYRDKTIEMIRMMGFYWGSSDFIILFQIFLVVMGSIVGARRGVLSVGDTLVFMSYIFLIMWPLRNVGRILSEAGKVSVAIERLEEIFNEPIEDLESGQDLEIEGSIIFENVSFQYDDGDHPVLRNVSFMIPKNSTVAIMGPTGSGKSSLVQLLTRLYEVSEGQIYIDHVPITMISKKSLREQVGIVLQDPFLYSRSIGENIRIAKSHASFQEVQNAANMAAIHDVIESFDQGYQTLVGEKGVTLSGGQKQRVAIARTLLMNQPILIFDDSLSALDAQTDRKIREALAQNASQSTHLIITHRVNSAQEADRIMVLDKGRLVQMGTHEQLLEEEGIYRRIAILQGVIDDA